MNPQEQHKFADVDYATYYILGFVLAFGLVVLALLGLAMWLDCRRREAEGLQRSHPHQGKAQAVKSYNDDPKGQVENHHLYGHTHSADLSNRNLYPNPEIEEKESLFDGSMVTTTTTEIQPKAPPLSCEKIDEMSRKSSAFGMLNIHQQQRQSNASSSTDFGMHNSVSNQQFPMHPPSSSSTTNVSSNVSLSGNSKRISKMESFPYEEYGIPEDERQPIKTRVQDLKTYDHFLRLTRVDSELLREDSIDDDRSSGNDDDGRVGRFESQATLPRDSFDRPAN